jgi:hypothetical protein
MLTIAVRALFEVLTEDHRADKNLVQSVKGLDIEQIFVVDNGEEESWYTCDVHECVDQVVEAINSGYTIGSWYGPNGESLIIGYRPDQLTLTYDTREWARKK